ncbi:Na+/H+ antiporter NhaC family protein [Clostridium chromiireducens]|uniref:Na+/H+ antiporter NhaC family protein n=2 Tax=Clostridium chromiireducens TaxID=225345 RepID=A0A399ITC4_9CLOT|nr:Na+/H+ antiporter NhaC family protein [Clostridium chromiireducens]RII35797.1 Na+/H+ antiporter NhaC family protein [Clostridium chromiireducens]
MEIAIAFIVCFLLLICSSIKGIFVGYSLSIGLLMFIILACKRKFKLMDVLRMAYNGGKKSFIVLQIFILIGAVTSTWMASGTVPAIVYYGIKLLDPNTFIISVFLICSAVSFLLGTSFGTVGTVGVAFMVMARGGDANLSLVAGAILSGAYFGDRCSPMSSSANLVANITETNLYTNIKNMFRSSSIPLVIAVFIYLIFSFMFPLNVVQSNISSEIVKTFDISIITLIPALIVLVFCIFRINVKVSIAISIIAASIISMAIQQNSVIDIIRYIIMGYDLKTDSILSEIIKGGGIVSMLKSAYIVFVSSAFTGIFEGTKMLESLDSITNKSDSRAGSFFTTIIVSIITSAFGCTQTLALILTHMLVKKNYEENGINKESLALDIENSAIVIAPLIPWNIALLVPLATLNAGESAILYAFYLYLIPLTSVLYFKMRNSKKLAIQD